MKILLDENLPHALRVCLPDHDVATAAYVGWAGVKNGELLILAESAGFDVMLTGDRNLAYQQNFRDRRIAIVELTDQRWLVLRDHIPEIAAAVNRALPGSFEVVVCVERP